MAELTAVMKQGLLSGVRTLLMLFKICVPVYFGVRLLEALGWLAVLGGWMQPLMSVMGLPGEAAVPLVLGATINIYSLLGAVAALDLSMRQMTIVAGFTLMAHSLFMEGLIMVKTHANIALLTVIRLVSAVIMGLLLNWLLPMGV